MSDRNNYTERVGSTEVHAFILAYMLKEPNNMYDNKTIIKYFESDKFKRLKISPHTIKSHLGELYRSNQIIKVRGGSAIYKINPNLLKLKKFILAQLEFLEESREYNKKKNAEQLIKFKEDKRNVI